MKASCLVIIGIVLAAMNTLAFYSPEQGRWLSRDPVDESGDVNLYVFCGNSPISFVDFLGLLTSSDALSHYQSGSDNPKNTNERTPLRMSFNEIDTTKIKADQFPQVAKQMKDCKPGTYQIRWGNRNDNLPFSTSGDQALFLGDISLKLEGTLIIGENGNWNFTGQLKSFDDYYDFNVSTHRGAIGETLTWVGRGKITGKPYWIEIRGAKQLKGEGNCCKDKSKSEKGRRKWY
jgi:uncharacterized protein RhaS with RHS repeats